VATLQVMPVFKHSHWRHSDQLSTILPVKLPLSISSCARTHSLAGKTQCTWRPVIDSAGAKEQPTAAQRGNRTLLLSCLVSNRGHTFFSRPIHNAA
jgi:hypothetical protein